MWFLRLDMSIRAVKNLNKKFENNVLGQQRKLTEKCEHFDNINTAVLNGLATCLEKQDFENVNFLVAQLKNTSTEILLDLRNLKKAIAKYNEQVLAEEKRFNSSGSFGSGILRWTAEMNQLYNLQVFKALTLDLKFTKEKYYEVAIKFWNWLHKWHVFSL